MGQVIATGRSLRPSSDLRSYQRAVAERIADGESIFLNWGVGSGKTAPTGIGVLRAMLRGKLGIAVVVSTGAIVRAVWPASLAEWEETSKVPCVTLVGTPAQRRDALAQALAMPLAFVAVSVDLLPWLVRQEDFMAVPKIAIFDEASLLRNARGVRFRAGIRLAASARQRICLSASLTPNNIVDVFAPIALVDLGKTLGTSISKFEARTTVRTGRRAWNVAERPGARGEVVRDIAHLVNVVRTVDVVDLPPLQRLVLEVELPDAARRIYDELEARAFDALHGMDVHLDARIAKLQQVANGFLYDEDGAATRLHEAKVDAACDVIEPLLAAGQQVMVVYNLREDVQAIMRRFPGAEILGASNGTRPVEEVVSMWNSGNLQVMCANPRSCGHGLNLQHAPAGVTQVWVNGTWSAELYEQTVGRLWRPGIGRPVVVYVIAAADTIDAAVISCMDRKLKASEVIRVALMERKYASKRPDLAAMIREARIAVGRAHPDKGGTEAAFREAWARLCELRDRLAGENPA
jgi:hypothetical protein